MSRWQQARVADVLFFQEGPGVRNTQYTSSGVKLLNVANLQDGKIDLSTSERYISEEQAYGKYQHFLVDEGDFIIASSGIKVEYFEKKMGLIKKEHLPLCMNTSTIRFKVIDDNQLYIRYFMYYLKTISFKKQLGKLITGSAQLNFGPSHLNKLTFPLPPLKTQKRIAKTLDTTAELLAMRKQQLLELDNLINSTFYDMFGDPFDNEKGWEIKNLRNLSFLITKGSSPTWQGINYTDDESQVLFVTSENVREGYLDFTKRKYLENKFNEIQRRSTLQFGDLLINIVGASIGRAAIFYSNEVANINQAVAMVRCNKDVCLSYMCHYFNSPKALQMYGEMQVDVARANLSLKNIGDLSVMYPPLTLQTQFGSIVTKIEEQKTLVKKAIDETQSLLDSVMVEYFE